MNIVLTGMRGSGKSYYGRQLAKLLGWEFVDTDDIVTQKAGMEVSELVQKHGWQYFRKLEKELCRELSTLDEHVISTGGGIIIDRENEQLLKKNGKIILLYRSPEKCAEYILQDTKALDRPSHRPSLTGKDLNNPAELLKELEELWQEREKRYRTSADLIIDTNKKTNPEQILSQLQEI